MRKIDALLLSALVLYDYSAQSLADNSFTTIPEEKHYTVDSLYLADEYNSLLERPENVHFFDMPEIVITAPVKSYVDLPEIVITAKSKIEQYQDLPEIIITTSKKAKHADYLIGMPDPTEDMALLEPVEAEAEVAMTVEVENATVQIEKVTVGRLAKDLQFVDSDGDGVYDYEDKCISVPGVARFEGCPVPDSDGDGINDEEDKCPFEAGLNENGGCPLQKENIDFTEEVFNSSTWLKKIPDSQQ